MFEITILLTIGGVLLGGLVNAFADVLPDGLIPRFPKYPDGGRRPFLAWLGISAFLFNLRRQKATDIGTGPEGLSWRYPSVEIAATALLHLFYHNSRINAEALDGQTLLLMIYSLFFVLITVVDIEHRRIPIMVIAPLAALALVDAAIFTRNPPGILPALIGGLLGFVVFYIVYLGGYIFIRFASRTHRSSAPARAFGFGDVLLMTVAGLIVGFPDVITVMYLTVFGAALAALVSLGYRYLLARNYRAFSTIAYGPFIIAGTISTLLLGEHLSFLLPVS